MINSTHFQTAEDTGTYLKEYKMTSAGLIDSDGAVGRLYGARTTPHMYVIDKKGVLQYSGAFDDDRRGQKGDDATNYAVNAIRQLAAEEKVSPNTTTPYGCSVKYKKAEDEDAGRRGRGGDRGDRGRRGGRGG